MSSTWLVKPKPIDYRAHLSALMVDCLPKIQASERNPDDVLPALWHQPKPCPGRTSNLPHSFQLYNYTATVKLLPLEKVKKIKDKIAWRLMNNLKHLFPQFVFSTENQTSKTQCQKIKGRKARKTLCTSGNTEFAHTNSRQSDHTYKCLNLQLHLSNLDNLLQQELGRQND